MLGQTQSDYPLVNILIVIIGPSGTFLPLGRRWWGVWEDECKSKRGAKGRSNGNADLRSRDQREDEWEVEWKPKGGRREVERGSRGSKGNWQGCPQGSCCICVYIYMYIYIYIYMTVAVYSCIWGRTLLCPSRSASRNLAGASRIAGFSYVGFWLQKRLQKRNPNRGFWGLFLRTVSGAILGLGSPEAKIRQFSFPSVLFLLSLNHPIRFPNWGAYGHGTNVCRNHRF